MEPYFCCTITNFNTAFTLITSKQMQHKNISYTVGCMTLGHLMENKIMSHMDPNFILRQLSSMPSFLWTYCTYTEPNLSPSCAW
jgi:hypothetical protein